MLENVFFWSYNRSRRDILLLAAARGSVGVVGIKRPLCHSQRRVQQQVLLCVIFRCQHNKLTKGLLVI